MVDAKPRRAEENLVKWTEFLAEFKELPNLEPYGVHLSFAEYHSLDVIAFICSVASIILGVVFLILRYVFRRLYGLIRGSTSSSTKQKVQ